MTNALQEQLGSGATYVSWPNLSLVSGVKAVISQIYKINGMVDYTLGYKNETSATAAEVNHCRHTMIARGRKPAAWRARPHSAGQ